MKRPTVATDDVLYAMDKFGGNFIRQLARLYRVADATNQETLEMAFRDYFRSYAEMTGPRREPPA